MARSERDVQEFLELAQDRFRLAAESEAATRKESLDDLEFSIGNQWPQDIKAQRQLDSKPCLTMNRLPQFIRQVTNEQRQNRPAIQINPVGDDADVDTSEILQGIVRHIEVNSRADESYDGGFDYMVRIGFGCWRIVTDWIAEETEDQEIYIVPIDNPFTVYLDPTNRRDPDWGFIIEDLLASEFKRQFGESRYAKGTASFSEYESVGDMPAAWALTIDGQEHVRIAEYFQLHKSKGDRGREKRKVEWAKISALEILDDRAWPGKFIPIVKIYGDDLNVNGKRHVAGLVRYAKDPQRAYNYWISAATERIALAPKAPWIAAEGQLEGHERAWEQSNVRNTAVLYYKPTDVAGKPVDAPQRNIVEPGIQGMTDMLGLATQDMQATTGLYPNNLGQQQTANESGKAVLARQKQGDIATLNYSDNLSRGIEYTGRVILDLIPKVYSAPRIQRIIKPDNTPSLVGIYNSKNDSEQEAQQAINNPDITKLYDIGTGRYDVTVSVGPSFQTKRQEAVVTQLALLQANPNLFPIIGDIAVRNMDIPGSKEMADRLKKAVPPQLLDDQDNSPEAQLMQAHQQLQQFSQQNGIMAKAMQDMQKVIEGKQIEQQGKMQIEQMRTQSDQVIQKAQIDAKIAIAEITTKAQIAVERATIFKEVWTELHGSAHELALQQGQQAHEQNMGQQQAAAGQQEQASDQAHESGMQQADQSHESGMAASGQAHELGMAAVNSENGQGEE